MSASKSSPAAPIVRLQAWVLRAPHDRPVRTSFGTMRDRPALLLRLEDREGGFGWGEVWCNWPACGAEHRLRLLEEDVAPGIQVIDAAEPSVASQALGGRLAVKAIQTGEPGPYAQMLAGVDIALCDLAARRAGLPLHRWLDRGSAGHVAAYASGIHIDDVAHVVPASRAAGFGAFKVKVGFRPDGDIAAVADLCRALASHETLMADANQAWTLEAARYFLDGAADAGLAWLEEPLRADTSWPVWKSLAAATAVPLAAGENLPGRDAFAAAIESAALGVIQPDVAKWGGVTGCFEVARLARAGGRRYCPHFLGAGIGLVASAHLLAAAGGDGLLEIDVNPNPLRSDLVGGWPDIDGGRVVLPHEAGLGLVPDPAVMKAFATDHIDLHL